MLRSSKTVWRHGNTVLSHPRLVAIDPPYRSTLITTRIRSTTSASPSISAYRLPRKSHSYATAAVSPAASQLLSSQANEPATPANQAGIHPEGVQEKFSRLGLNTNICRQITSTHPHIQRPTPAQSALIPAILSPTDVILRAHTGTGKSFGILLASLNKPRIVFKDDAHPRAGKLSAKDAVNNASSAGPRKSKIQTGIASIILVPSNELAFQYMNWARTLFPPSALPSLDPVIQCLVRGGMGGPNSLTPEEEQRRLKNTPPHILIGTPGRIKDILDTPAGHSLLGIDTLRTLVLDEADALLQLPGRFPSNKQRWKHEVHKAPGLDVLNSIMKKRPTYSGGDKHLSAGLENRPGKRKDERRPPEHIRRNAYKGAEASNSTTGLALPRERVHGSQPLQLVCTSATANSVLRHFFGARTGWLRTGAKDNMLTFAPQTGRWIDLTGLSGKSMVDQGIRGLFGTKEVSQADDLVQSSLNSEGSTMPSTIEHTCVVVDEAPLSRKLDQVPLRNFSPRLARKKSGAEVARMEDEYLIVKPESEPQEHEIDQTLLEALAFCFASEGVDRGLALIPARWSLLKTRAVLEALGVSVRLASDAFAITESPAKEGPELFLLQTTSSRGLDIPSLSHVFLVGYHSVIDAVQYIHSAGRVSRLGSGADQDRNQGKVVTLLRGIPHDTIMEVQQPEAQFKDPISVSEFKMANVYKRLGIVPKKLDLSLLKETPAATQEAATPTDPNTPDLGAVPVEESIVTAEQDMPEEPPAVMTEEAAEHSHSVAQTTLDPTAATTPSSSTQAGAEDESAAASHSGSLPDAQRPTEQ